MKYIQGEILSQHGFQKGYLSFKKNEKPTFNRGLPPEKPMLKGLIIPSLINAHTHVGDSFIKKNSDFLLIRFMFLQQHLQKSLKSFFYF